LSFKKTLRITSYIDKNKSIALKEKKMKRVTFAYPISETREYTKIQGETNFYSDPYYGKEDLSDSSSDEDDVDVGFASAHKEKAKEDEKIDQKSPQESSSHDADFDFYPYFDDEVDSDISIDDDPGQEDRDSDSFGLASKD